MACKPQIAIIAVQKDDEGRIQFLLREDKKTVYTREELIKEIKSGADVYTKDAAGHTSPIKVFRNDWLKTEPDNAECDNLDNLPTFSYSC